MPRESLRSLPSVDSLLAQATKDDRFRHYPHALLLRAARQMLAEYRRTLLAEQRKPRTRRTTSGEAATPDWLAKLTEAAERLRRPSLRPVINATGIVLNTNLGRAPLSEIAVTSLTEIGGRYSDLEFDLESGMRGERYTHVESLLCEITGAEGAVAVNNNAAAMLLILNTFAIGKQVVISRGQMIEIGGAFRIPDVLLRSGATLVEVGTTNRTYLSDYERAVTPQTALFLRCHTSNYRVIGFVHEVQAKELAELGRKHGILTVDDLGSGLLVDLQPFGLQEPLVTDSLRAGIDLVTFSGDKLLGGPQAGIILGRRQYVDPLKKNPLLRAIRIDKLTLAALEATLRIYRDEDSVANRIPVLRLIGRPLSEVEQEARTLASALTSPLPSGLSVQVEPGFSGVGGGSLPGSQLPTALVSLTHRSFSPDELARLLRLHDPPIICRIAEDKVLLDMRTVLPGETEQIVKAVQRIAGS
jgi:L-seryl-tRNA(Ser) seleniumtransferase